MPTGTAAENAANAARKQVGLEDRSGQSWSCNYQVTQESLVKTQAPPDTAAVQARPLPAVARPYLLASYSEDDVLGVIDGDSFLA